MFSSVRHSVIAFVVSVACLGGFTVRDADAQLTGVKVGMQWSTVRFDGSSDAGLTRRLDPLGGVFFQFGEGPLMVQLEGLVSRRGARAEVNGVRTDSNVIY